MWAFFIPAATRQWPQRAIFQGNHSLLWQTPKNLVKKKLGAPRNKICATGRTFL